MNPRREPFWGWPGWGPVRYAVFGGLAFTLWFALVYGGAEFLTEWRDYRVRLHLDGELAVPFVPAAVLGYVSIYPLFWMAPFVLRTRRELRALLGTLAAVTLCGGVGFLLFPADPAFPPPGDLGAWEGLVEFARRVALRHNFAPSLHVTLSVVCVAVYAGRAGPTGKVLLWTWSALISVSTLLLHQHYIVDVVAGYGLGLAGVHYGYRLRVAPGVLSPRRRRPPTGPARSSAGRGSRPGAPAPASGAAGSPPLPSSSASPSPGT